MALLAVLAAGCSGSSKPTSSGTTSETAFTTTTSTEVPVPTSAGSTGVSIDVTANAQFANGRQAGYMHAVNVADHTLTIDIIQFFVGEAANRAAKEDGQETPVPNDYYIRNVNPKLYTFPVAASASLTVLASEPESGGSTDTRPVDLAGLATIVNGHAAKDQATFNPWWITTSNGTVVKVEEQFVP